MPISAGMLVIVSSHLEENDNSFVASQNNIQNKI